MASATEPGAAEALLAEAWPLAADDPAAQARLLTAEAFRQQEIGPTVTAFAERAVAAAQRVGDPLIESAALDVLTSAQLARGEVRAAAASALRRTEILTSIRITARSALEFADGLSMAAECAIAAGDLATARHLSERVRDLPFHREEGHLATARLIVVTMLAGEWDETGQLAERFREGWERAGSPRAGNLSRAAYAAATVFALRGDGRARAAWLDVVHALATPGRPMSAIHFGEFFEAWVALHQGEPEGASRQLTTPPEEFQAWHNGLWRPWYAALWAEAAVLTGNDATGRVGRARRMTADNPIAAAIVDRAAALLAGDPQGLRAGADRLAQAGCRYQWARTLVMIGGPERERGEATLAQLGATEMVW